MDPITYNKPKSVVLHNSGTEPVLVAYAAGATIYPGNRITDAEPFDDPLDAIARARELGVTDTKAFWPAGKVYDPVGKRFLDAPETTPEWTADGTFDRDAIVWHNGKTWLHISDRQGEPDEVYDIEKGTGDWVKIS